MTQKPTLILGEGRSDSTLRIGMTMHREFNSGEGCRDSPFEDSGRVDMGRLAIGYDLLSR